MKARILLAGKDQDLAEILATLFSHHDFGFEFAQDLEQVSAAIRRAPPDLLILDSSLTGVSVHQFVQALSPGAQQRKLFVLMLCGEPGKSESARAKAAGVNAWLSKPFSCEQLLESVRQALGGHSDA